MGKLRNVVYLSEEQYEIIRSGGTVSGLTLNDNDLYMTPGGNLIDGPSLSVANGIAAFADTSGKVLTSPTATITPSGIISSATYKTVGGSMYTPSYTFIDDTATGMYQPASTQIGFTADGDDQLKISPTGVFVNNWLGVGTSTPTEAIDVEGKVKATGFISTATTGTAPFTVSSTTLVNNLNADLLDGQHGSYYTSANNLSGTIPSAVLGNSTHYIGTTAVTLNRASATLALTGVTNTNWDSAYTHSTTTTGAVHGATTVGNSFFRLINPSAITFPRINANNTVSALSASDFRTAIGAGTSSTTGTVTSVSGTGNVSGISLTGTVNTTGSLTLGGSISGLTTSNLSASAGIKNTQLANSSITVGTTSISLGNSSTILTGLTSVTSTTLTTGAGTQTWQITDSGSSLLFQAGTSPATKATLSSAGALTIAGKLSATSKSFLIDHPTKPGYKLQYGSLEGPENGVYVRGRLTNNNIIELPDYWRNLVDEDSITVSLTAIGKAQKLFVEKIKNNKIYIKNSNRIDKNINCFYVVYGERKDVDKLEVEMEAK